jgi:hypothetical protein
MQGISLVAEKLLFSLQKICCMELVNLALKKLSKTVAIAYFCE